MLPIARSATWIAAFAILCLCALLPAQAGATHDAQSGANSGGAVTPPLQIAVTGCLKQEGEGGEYFVVDKNGRTWKLTANGLKLAEHVNQEVMITGKPDAYPPQQGHKDEKSETSGELQIRLRALTVKALGPKCSR